MNFSEPIYLFLIFLIPIIIFALIVIWKNKKDRINKFINLKLINELIPEETWERQRIKMILTVTALFFILFGLAGPRFGTKMTTIERKGVDVLIAVDTSLSMLAEDIKPNRMTRAREELKRLAAELEGNRIGIIAFAGLAFVQCPLTLDPGAVKLFMNYLDVGIVPQQGTEIGAAIRLAVKTFSQAERKHKVLIILTDGEDHNSDPINAAEDAKKEGITIYTIGFGNKDGEIIPIKDQNSNLDYKKDKNGRTIMSRLDAELLMKIALITDGKYFYANKGNIEIDKIADLIKNMDKKDLSQNTKNRYEERFYYFIFIGLFILILELFIRETVNRK
ncbi:MAG: VWA domain-containing protein [Elusimicrobiota bacterium]